jgi:hypothetical protein
MQAETKAVLIKDIVTLQEHDAPDEEERDETLASMLTNADIC